MLKPLGRIAHVWIMTGITLLIDTQIFHHKHFYAWHWIAIGVAGTLLSILYHETIGATTARKASWQARVFRRQSIKWRAWRTCVLEAERDGTECEMSEPWLPGSLKEVYEGYILAAQHLAMENKLPEEKISAKKKKSKRGRRKSSTSMN